MVFLRKEVALNREKCGRINSLCAPKAHCYARGAFIELVKLIKQVFLPVFLFQVISTLKYWLFFNIFVNEPKSYYIN